MATDGTWAFDADRAGAPLEAWGHYYVEVVPSFSGGQSRAVSTRVGPLSLPGDGGAPVAVLVKPVQLALLEGSAAGGAMTTRWATAHVFDLTNGDEIEAGAASVSLWIGSSQAPLSWGPISARSSAYAVQFPGGQFAAAPPAQATYRMTTTTGSGAPAGGPPSTSTLVIGLDRP